MHLTRKLSRSPVSAPTILFALALLCVSQVGAQNDSANIRIKNFGQMDERFFRGAQPRESDYPALAALGVKTVIDLRDKPQAYEKPAVEALGMRYVNIPMSDKDYPKMEQITQFLQLMDNPATGKVFVHCAGGRHRTGVMGAVYRFNKYHWTYEQVYSEMKAYDFYTRWGHGDMKKFVRDYWQQIQTNGFPASAAGLPVPAVNAK
jgi:protein tyrosine/serine phosphatase